jgi:hypothetical protein
MQCSEHAVQRRIARDDLDLKLELPTIMIHAALPLQLVARIVKGCVTENHMERSCSYDSGMAK